MATGGLIRRDYREGDVLDRITDLENRVEDLQVGAFTLRDGTTHDEDGSDEGWHRLSGWNFTEHQFRDDEGKIILDGRVPSITIEAGGYIESSDFVSGSAGFQINGGVAEFNDVTVRGTIYATLGEVGGWTIGTDTLSAGNVTLSSADPSFDLGNTGGYMAGEGIWLGNDGGTYKMHVGDPAGSHMRWDGSKLLVTGPLVYVRAASLLCHFDGPRPYKSNFDGSLQTHYGHEPDSSGGHTFRPGIFGKAVQCAKDTTNLAENPRFENNITDWWSQAQGGTGGSWARNTTYQWIGAACLELVAGDANVYSNSPTGGITLADGATMTLHVRAMGDDGANGRITLYDGTNSTHHATTFTTSGVGNDRWTRYATTFTNSTGGSAQVYIVLYNDTNDSSSTIYYDGVMWEQNAFATPYADGGMGPGHSWQGTGHNSKSDRTDSDLRYRMPEEFEAYTTEKGSILVWAYRDDWTAKAAGGENEFVFSFRLDGDNIARCYVNTGENLRINWVGDASSTHEYVDANTLSGWQFIGLTWDFTDGKSEVAFYLNGEQLGIDTSAPPMLNNATTLSVGQAGWGATDQLGGLVDELVVSTEVLTEDDFQRIYQAEAPVVDQTNVWGVQNNQGIVRITDDGLTIAYSTDDVSKIRWIGPDGNDWAYMWAVSGGIAIYGQAGNESDAFALLEANDGPGARAGIRLESQGVVELQSGGSPVFQLDLLNETATLGGLYGNRVAFVINSSDGDNREITFQSSGGDRWHIAADDTAEDSGDTGSDFEIVRYDNAGLAATRAIFIKRSTGDTTLYGGTTTLGNGSGQAQVIIDGGAGNNRRLDFQSGGSNRWLIYVNIDSESGSNAGSNFQINRYDDAGSYLGAPLHINRSSGYVGINDGDPDYQLDVNGSARVQGDVGIGRAPNYRLAVKENVANYIAAMYNQNGSSSAHVLRLLGGEYTNPDAKYIQFNSGDDSQVVGDIKGDGSGGVDYGSSSDRRTKDVQAYVDGENVLSMMEKVIPFTYYRKGGPSELGLGFGAQDFAEYRSIAWQGEDGYWMMDYGKVTPLLWAAVRALAERNQELVDRITELEERG
jgi:hypothetical protein